MPSLNYFDVRSVASALAFAAHGRYMAESEAQAAFHERQLVATTEQLMRSLARLPPDTDTTYLVVDEGGTFREAERGQSRAEVVHDIATGEFEAAQVLRLRGAFCEDVTDEIAAEVLDRLEATGPGREAYIPGLAFDRCPTRAEALRQSWQSPEERQADHIDNLRDDRHTFMLEAAE